MYKVLVNNDVIKQMKRFKYIDAYIDRKGLGETEMRQKIHNSRKIIECLFHFAVTKIF